jgi:hypothetical protein
VTTTLTVPTVTVTTTFLPPAFSNVTVMDQLTVNELCTDLLAAGTETIHNELNADYYSNLSNYEAMRASRSMFNTFDNAVTITAADGAGGDQFGVSVALSGDGSTLVVGARNAGAGRVFIGDSKIPGHWLKKLTIPMELTFLNLDNLLQSHTMARLLPSLLILDVRQDRKLFLFMYITHQLRRGHSSSKLYHHMTRAV